MLFICIKYQCDVRIANVGGQRVLYYATPISHAIHQINNYAKTMAAPKGNMFWMNRSKHGRDKLFATPALLWGAACEYFGWCDNNPWHRNEALKSGTAAGTIIGIPTVRPYTYTGLCLYLGCSESYFRMARKRAGDANNDDLLAVLDAIDNVITTQQYEGAVLGFFNTGIVNRALGLKEQSAEVANTDNQPAININIITGDAPKLASSEDEIEV